MNTRLARARAAAVARYLADHGRDLFAKYERTFPFGAPRIEASRERLHDLPGVEAGCNRAAHFQFVTERKYVEMYSRAQAREWLKEWLEEARKVDADDDDQVLARRDAKNRYHLAVKYIDMVEAGHTEPTQNTPASRVLDDPDDLGAKRSIEQAYERARADDPYLKGLDSAAARRRHRERMARDPYYRYTYEPNEEYKAEADQVEREMFGSVTPWGYEER